MATDQFDPDAYLAESTGFDPDAYLAESTVEPPPVGPSTAEQIFPTGMAARQKAMETGSVWDQAKAVVAPAMDVLSLPSRAVASMRGQQMEDPDAYVFKPEVEKYQQGIQENLP